MMNRTDKILLLVFTISVGINLYWYRTRQVSLAQERSLVSISNDATKISQRCHQKPALEKSQCRCEERQNTQPLEKQRPHLVDTFMQTQERTLDQIRKQCRIDRHKQQFRSDPSRTDPSKLREQLSTLCFEEEEEESCKQLTAIDQQQCQRGENSFICTSVAIAYIEGRPGIETNPSLGFSLLEEDCHRRNNINSCIFLAKLYLENSSSSEAEKAKGIAISQQHCTPQTNDWYCDGLAKLYEEGTLGQKDKNQAYLLYQRSCDAGNTGACYALGPYLLKEGMGTEKEVQTFKARMIKSCQENKDFYACRFLAEQVIP